MNKATVTILLLTACVLILAGCAKMSSQPTPASDSDIAAVREITEGGEVEDQEAVFPRNEYGNPVMQWKSSVIEMHLTQAFNTNKDLKGGPFPSSYEELISTGLLPIMFHNRYTGQPVVNTAEYSRGDIYYSVDAISDTLVYSIHFGDQDQTFDPDLTNGQYKPCECDPRYATTDGKTIRWEMRLPSDLLADSPASSDTRESFNIPAGDDSRASIFIVYQSISKFMYKACENLDALPGSLDDYIALIGEKNPSAWINPYTGLSMTEVGWYDVPLYYDWDRLAEPITTLKEDGQNIPEGIAGNYSFNIGDSPLMEGETRAYVKFYFKEPDGSISAYLAIGLGPNEARQMGLEFF